MKKHKGLSYIEVVAVISRKNIATSDRSVISGLISTKQVKTYIDKNDIKLVKSIIGVRKEPVVLFYLCKETNDIINALDIKKEYLLDNKPVTAYELIKEARRIMDTDQIFDTNSAARLLRDHSRKVTKNKYPTFKYEFTN